MNVQYNMVVDFARPSKTNTLIVSEGDTNSRVCCFTLLFNKQPFNMADVSTVVIKAIKQNGSIVYDDASIVTDDLDNKLNEIQYTIRGDMTNTAGRVTMTITLMSTAGEKITSFEFYLNVRNALYNEDDYVSDDTVTGFRDILNRCMITIEDAESSANTARETAASTQEVLGTLRDSIDSIVQLTVDDYLEEHGEDLISGGSVQDGFSPNASVAKVDNRTVITITDKNGTTIAEVLDGSDGHTPIKGVDYFDGYTPIKGVDYFDGQPGYTPVKGVDYFDGAKGDAFKYSDFTQAQLAALKGDKGEPGHSPVKGTDYFTAADKADFLEDVLDMLFEEIPNGEEIAY